MTTPFDALVLETASTVSVKYTINKVQSRYSLPFTTSVKVGELLIDKNIKHIDPENVEVDYDCTLQSENDIQLQQLEIEFNMNLENQNMLAEGFQCWSTTKEMDKDSKLSAIPSVVSWVTKFNLQGDYDFFNYSGQPGKIHATGYTYFRNTKSDAIVFLGSVSESSGYTYFKADLKTNRFTIYKDIDGKILKKGDHLKLRFFLSQRDAIHGLRSIWDKYAEYYDPNQTFKNPRHLTGWSSWYNVYENVTEDDVISSLIAFKQHKYPIDVFQIDDGYETQVGDWLDVDAKKFPRGMKILAEDISKQHYIPGIWLAPYAVGFKSKIVKEHPDWLLKHPDGSLVVAGPNWGGFYAIDIYNADARRYLQDVFDQVIDGWGYKLLKLDFLFAAAMIPRLGKSRGEIMSDAMDIIVEITKKRAILLGSGVPLPSVWGKLEYSRVSSDASPWWDHSVLRIANVRERVSTNNAITSTLNRWPMGSTIFGSDPDVFFVRSSNNKLTNDEKHTLLVINIIFGQLTLMSDNVHYYHTNEHKLYGSIFPKPEAQVQELKQIGNDVYQASYTCHYREYLFYTNLSSDPFTAQLPAGEADYYFEQCNVLIDGCKVDFLKPLSSISLRSHETRKFMKLSLAKMANDKFMGSTGHIVPGSEVDSIIEQQDNNSIHVNLKKRHVHKKSRLFIRINSNIGELPSVLVDDQVPSRVERIDWDDTISFIKVVIYE